MPCGCTLCGPTRARPRLSVSLALYEDTNTVPTWLQDTVASYVSHIHDCTYSYWKNAHKPMADLDRCGFLQIERHHPLVSVGGNLHEAKRLRGQGQLLSPKSEIPRLPAARFWRHPPQAAQAGNLRKGQRRPARSRSQGPLRMVGSSLGYSAAAAELISRSRRSLAICLLRSNSAFRRAISSSESCSILLKSSFQDASSVQT